MATIVDFIDYKSSLDVIKRNSHRIPDTELYVFKRVWIRSVDLEGNFSRFSFTDYKKPTYHDYLIFEIEGHNHVWVDVDSLGIIYFMETGNRPKQRLNI